ncbi:hypothetical protein DM01DRAFT_1338052 [Hesseltinella vesiculosa]|uniref:Rieske domain-containing protein n=1 Tax=Hesseltinella vesiculosa TaxID=101127 RepID=A0A1X2GBL7_9FUNG|nr:hypothetical protein DM01DRAFT_1338052 [Hesseltinella vesiculosa]
MGKKGFSLFESYMSSLSVNDPNEDQETPLPDSMRSSTLLEQIGKERGWTDDQVQSDIQVLQNNRLHFVRDLRSLSDHSWTVIDILPLVRDLLRQGIRIQGKPGREGSSNESLSCGDDVKEKKKKDKKDKKDKKKKDKKLGKSVQPSVLVAKDEVAMAMEPDGGGPSQEDILADVLSDDPETIRNTINNGSMDLGKGLPDEDADATHASDRPKKTVSFSEQDATIPCPDKSKPAVVLEDSSDESSTTSSSSSDEASVRPKKAKDKPSAPTNGFSSTRPIQVVTPNRIRVKTGSGTVYECDRFCPHKGVDLATWGQVIGNTLVCSKHNWRFNLTGASTNGRSVHPCQVNDW